MIKHHLLLPFCLFLFLLVAGFHSQAITLNEVDQWEPLQGSGDNLPMISAIAEIPGTTIAYVGYTNGYLYLSYNTDTPSPDWIRLDENQPISHSMITCIATNPSDFHEVYVAYNGTKYYKLYKSHDAGKTWTTLSTFPSGNIWSLSINPLNPQQIYAIAEGVVFTSNDAGCSWSTERTADLLNPLMSDQDQISTISISSVNPAHILAGTKLGEIYMCRDIKAPNPEWKRIDCIDQTRPILLPNRIITGLIWDEKQNPPAIYVSFGKIIKYPDDQDGIWLTYTNGEIWTNINTANIPRYTGIYRLSTHPYYKHILYAGHDYGASKTINNGEYWFNNASCSGNNLLLMSRTGDPGAALDNSIKPSFIICNNGSIGVPLNELTIRYWYTKEDTQIPEIFNIDYAGIESADITGTFKEYYPDYPGASYYLEINFLSQTVLAPGKITGDILLRYNKQDWSAYTEYNDYSYISNSTQYQINSHITLYRNGQLIWGYQP